MNIKLIKEVTGAMRDELPFFRILPIEFLFHERAEF